MKKLIFLSVCVEKELENWKHLGEKFHMQDRHPKWLNIIYFFFNVKMYRVLLKVLARKGKKKVILHTGEEGGRLAQERVTWRSTKASRHPFPVAYKSP